MTTAETPNSLPTSRTPRKKSANGEGSLFLRGEIWYFAYSVNGVQRRESSGSTRQADAVKLRKLRITEHMTTGVTSVDDKKIKVGELLDDLVQDYRLQERKSLDVWAVYAIKPLREFFGGRRVSTVDSNTLDAYIAFRQAPTPSHPTGLSNSTINGELALLRRSFNLASRRRPSKVKFIPHFQLLPPDAARQGFFEAEELSSLLKVLPSYLVPVAVFAANTAARKSEVLGLTWDNVDLARNSVMLYDTKNGEDRLIPMTSVVKELLAERKALRDRSCPECPWVFFRPDGSQIKDFRVAWETACTAIGKPSAHFHDLRRTGIRNLRRSGVSEGVAMKISGHKTRDVFDRYNITSEEDIRQAAVLLSAYTNSKGATQV
jgi:integrase